uniref:ribosomal protein S7 n=1 Tax=Hydnora arabica TaxID=2952646 RepID=UPI002113CF99|nr:ribosomal protein S7 [Hydnora arabica]USN93615.1 ribosomal protein S7 [Hydnora arabica]
MILEPKRPPIRPIIYKKPKENKKEEELLLQQKESIIHKKEPFIRKKKPFVRKNKFFDYQKPKIDDLGLFYPTNINYKPVTTLHKPQLETIYKNYIPKPDPIYKNKFIDLLINKNLKNGKKSLSYRIICEAFSIIQYKTHSNPLIIFKKALFNLIPKLLLKSKKGRKTTQGKKMNKISVLVETKTLYLQAQKLAIQWLVLSSQEQSNTNLSKKLSSEIIEASLNKGNAIRKKDEYMKLVAEHKIYVFQKGRNI